MTDPTPIELGCKARDRVSGWTGIADSRYEYLNGCVRWAISGTDKDGKPETFTFDEEQIEVLEAPAEWASRLQSHLVAAPEPEPAEAPRRRTGGPRGNRPPARR